MAPQPCLDIFCVQILKVSQLPILQQSNFIRLTWGGGEDRTFPISEGFQIWGSPSRGLLDVLSGHPGLTAPGDRVRSQSTANSDGSLGCTPPICLPAWLGLGYPRERIMCPRDTAPPQFSKKQNSTKCS